MQLEQSHRRGYRGEQVDLCCFACCTTRMRDDPSGIISVKILPVFESVVSYVWEFGGILMVLFLVGCCIASQGNNARQRIFAGLFFLKNVLCLGKTRVKRLCSTGISGLSLPPVAF